MTEKDLNRLEGKLDTLTEAVNKLVLLEERQSIMAKTVDKQESELEKQREEIQRVEAKVDKWINRGFGAYAVLLVIVAGLKFFIH